ncbi:MAG: hypothetical protein ACI8RD_007650, partial [Bacillariaceae sp.]
IFLRHKHTHTYKLYYIRVTIINDDLKVFYSTTI